MNYIIATLVFIFCLFVSTSNACRYKSQSIEERFESAAFVYTAWVTGVHLTEFELLKENAMKEEPEDFFQVVGYEPKLFTLLLIEKFKGRRKSPTEVFGGMCGSGYVELKDRALFFVSKGDDGDYTSYVISESRNKEYYLESLVKVKELGN